MQNQAKNARILTGLRRYRRHGCAAAQPYQPFEDENEHEDDLLHFKMLPMRTFPVSISQSDDYVIACYNAETIP